MKSNTSIIYAIGIVGIFLLSYILWNINYSDKIENTENPGVIIDYVNYDTNSRKLSENEYWGKMLFKSNCTACHKINSSDNWPDVQREIKKYSDSLFFKYLTITKSTEEESSSKAFPDLDILQTTAIKEYLEALNE